LPTERLIPKDPYKIIFLEDFGVETFDREQVMDKGVIKI